MGEMAEYWKDVKPYLKERRTQHVKRMGDSATKILRLWVLNLSIIQIITNLRSIRQKG